MKIFIMLVLALAYFNTCIGDELRMSTFNIKNYNYDPRTGQYTDDQKLINIIKDISPDILAVQEIVNEYAFKELITANFKHYRILISECGGYARQKIGLIYNTKNLSLQNYSELSKVALSTECNSGLRPALSGHFKRLSDNKLINAIVVHLKAGGSTNAIARRFEQLQILKEYMMGVRQSGNSNIVLLGDFNTTNYLKKNDSYEKFIRFGKESNLLNLGDEVGCSSYWWGGIDDGLQHPGLLDHIMISHTLESSFSQVTATTGTHCKRVLCTPSSIEDLGESYSKVSDHCPITLTLRD